MGVDLGQTLFPFWLLTFLWSYSRQAAYLSLSGLYPGKLPCFLVLWATLGNMLDFWFYRDIFTLLWAILGKMLLSLIL